MLFDGQSYENDQFVLILEKWEEHFRALILKKVGDELRFSELIIKPSEFIEKVINKMGLKISSKRLIIK